ncbi:MAG TPA: glutamate-cysteine ligase family protein [Candidatus Dormibacteraeota bacterium]
MTVAQQVTRTSALERRVNALFLPAGGARGGPGRVGVEIELLPVRFTAGIPVPAGIADVQAALAHDPGLVAQARISFEPGGQVELSPAPQTSPAAALERAEMLITRLRRCADREGISLISAAVSPWHDPETIGLANPAPRYRAMQAHFDTIGPWGRRMMRQTAATQVCLDLGGQGGSGRGEAPRRGARERATEERWRILNRAGPALAAAFAASPLLDGDATGMRSARTAIWQGVDPDRTGFDGRHLGGDPVAGYTVLAMGAHAIPLPRAEGERLPARTPLRRLIATGAGRPDGDDLDHHLTTLFPAVRPRGYLEVRYLDALPGEWLAVPVCVLATLTAEPGARRRALEVLESDPTSEDWWRAARSGPADPQLRCTATALLDAAIAGMARLDRGYVPATAPALVSEYRDRFVAAGRCPADELLERHTARPEDPATWM